jgi:hypothetical protein
LAMRMWCDEEVVRWSRSVPVRGGKSHLGQHALARAASSHRVEKLEGNLVGTHQHMR